MNVIPIEYILDQLKPSHPQVEEFVRGHYYFPAIIILESSSRCNSNCIMCPRQARARPQLEMSDSIFYKVIDEFNKAGAKPVEINFHYGGEPLFLDIDVLVNRINYCKSVFPTSHLCFYTNASLLTEDKSLKIIRDSFLDRIAFSVDGGTKEDYERVRVGLNFDVVIDNIKTFVKLRNKFRDDKKSQLTTYSNIVPQLANEKSVQEYFRLLKQIGVDGVGGSGIITGGVIEESKYMLPHQGRLHDGKDFPCSNAFSFFSVTADGLVTACCYDFSASMVMGDVNKDNPVDVWRGETAWDFKLKHLKRLKQSISICKDCNYMDFVGILDCWK